ncbi:MAG: hypothetical protein AAB766_04460 [Patescibacteria group bacterium]
MKRLLLLGSVAVVLAIAVVFATGASAKTLAETLKGKILLQVEKNGEAWYVYPVNLKKYYLGKPADALKIMKELGLGATHAYITKYTIFPKSVWGKILLDVEDLGKAYYIYPVNGKGYYLGKPADAFKVMRELGLGISNFNLEVITSSDSTVSAVTSTGSTISSADLLASKYTCGICQPNEKCVSGKCTAVTLSNTNFCGNFKCETGESYNGKVDDVTKAKTADMCYLDCAAPASTNSNAYAKVECACDEYDVLKGRHSCIAAAKSACNSCGPQEELLDDVLSIQTEVIKCLSDYFEYSAPRLSYKVFYNPDLDKCDQTNGCTGIEGGVGGADYVLFNNLNGFRAKGDVVPTKASYLTADVHETAHYFLYQMLHAVPSWFHEAVAIQTNERLNCVSTQMADGDAYLTEKGKATGGILMGNKRYLDYSFYRDLRDGKISLTASQKEDQHIKGSLYIMGLKEDYKCGSDCVKDIVIKLHEKELDNCVSIDKSKCGVTSLGGVNWMNFWMGGVSESGANALVKEATNSVIGKDASKLFTLLNL